MNKKKNKNRSGFSDEDSCVEDSQDLLVPFNHRVKNAYKALNPKIEVQDEISRIFQAILNDLIRKVSIESQIFAEFSGRRVIKKCDIQAALNMLLPPQLNKNLKDSLNQ
jgi:histone H3/H4